MTFRLAFRLTRPVIKESNKKGEMNFLSAYKTYKRSLCSSFEFGFGLFEFRGTAVPLEGERPFSYGIQPTPAANRPLGA